MVVPEAARPPAESRDSPYAPSKSTKGKNTSVSSIASMKLLMRGVSPKDIFSRAPSRASSQIGLDRTSGAQGSGSSTLETIDQGASESDAETAARHVARLTKSEEERAKSIEVLLAKRDAGEAPSADEPSSAELRKELVGLEAKRAAASASVGASGAAAGASAAAPGSVRAASPAPSAVSEAVSGAPSVASVELDLPRATSRAGGGAPRRASAAIAASPYGSALRSKSKMRRAVGQVAAASAATRAMKPGKKKGTGVSAEAAGSPGHARTESAVVRALVRDAIATIAEDAIEPESTRKHGDASGRSPASAPSPGHARTDSAVVRGLVGDAIAKVSAVSDESGFHQTKATKDGSPSARRSGDGDDAPSSPTRAAPAPASSAKSRFRRAVSAVSMGSLFARARPRTRTTDPRGGAADAAEDPVKRLVQGALRAATEEEAGAEASSLGAYGALTEEEEERKKAILDTLARLDAATANGDGDGDVSDGDEETSSSSRLRELQTELIRLETKRVKAAAGGASNATLSTAFALTPQEEDRAAFLERLLARRESEGVPPSARPSADARRELIALLARRGAAEQAEDERASVLEAMLEANAEDANAEDADANAAAASARDELRALRERRAARRFDLVVTSPAVPPRGTNATDPVRQPHTRHRHQGRNHQGIEESESERKGAAFLTPKPPFGTKTSGPKRAGPGRVGRERARDALPSDASGPRPRVADPKRPESTQRSQFGPMVDSLKRSSPRVGFGSALRFDFQRASAPPPDSERGRTLRRSQSRLRAARGGAPAGLAAADDASGASFSVPGPGTYATTKYRAFGPQSDGEKKSFPAVSMGRAGRFAAAERETKTTRSWPGPDAYDAASSLGAQRVSRCDTLPRIAFTRARRAVGNVDGDGGDGVSENEGDAIPEGEGISGRRPRGIRFPGAGRWRSARDGGGGDGATVADSSRLYDSVGDQALSYHPNAPYAHFGTAFRERAGLASLSKKQAKKAMCGKLGPGPAYPAGPAAVGKQVHSGKTNAPAVGFTRHARLADAHSEDAAEEPGPGSYRV